jgi:hypothetical protein
LAEPRELIDPFALNGPLNRNTYLGSAADAGFVASNIIHTHAIAKTRRENSSNS